MKVSLSTWMDERKIEQARRAFDSALYRAEGIDPAFERIAAEGLACLENAEPEYLMNIIRQDHPDRVAAVQLLQEMG